MLLGTYAPVDSNSNAVSLTKIREGNFTSEFRGLTAVTGETVRVYVNHTLPDRGKSGESHLIKILVERTDSEGDYSHTSQSHQVIKTLDSVQSAAESVHTQSLMTAMLASSNVQDKLINGES